VVYVNLAYLKRLLRILAKGYRKDQFLSYTRILLHTYHRASTFFIETFSDQTDGLGDLDNPRIQKLHSTVAGLHQTLNDGKFSYSILVPVYKPDPDFFRKALRAACLQTAPDMEVLVGFDGPQPQNVVDTVREFLEANPNYQKVVRVFEFDRKNGGGISRTTNELASRATKKFLLLMDHDDWIRPDLLYRYELTLRAIPQPESTVLYCDEFKINERDQVIVASHLKKPDRPHFPYLFINWICHALLVPRSAWNSIGGLRFAFDGAQDFDLCLRLDTAGFSFRNVPTPLYAWRSHAQSTAFRTDQKDYASEAGLNAFKDYCANKGLDWAVTPGLVPTSYRGQPKLSAEPHVLAIVPFRDQRELTIKAIDSLKKQVGVKIDICAVDNRSDDKELSNDLQKLGVEVLLFDEPFNFSRINNFAVNKSASGAPILLFLNNDVELDSGALREMAAWLEQPEIGIVGCKLYFPNGLIQHGGVRLDPIGQHHRMQWAHVDKGVPDGFSGFSRQIAIVDAVTAAAAMMRRSDFGELGGFDELWYPIAFSDTDLCVRIRQRGQLCLFTPYATGIHHESITRKFNNIEDYESSRWLPTVLGRDRIQGKSFGIRGTPHVEQ